MRRAAKRDANEKAIVDAFRALGWSVDRLAGAGTPDLVIAKGSHVVLVEVKARNGTLTPDQERWHAQWRGPQPAIVRSVDDALRLANRVQMGLTEQ